MRIPWVLFRVSGFATAIFCSFAKITALLIQYVKGPNEVMNKIRVMPNGKDKPDEVMGEIIAVSLLQSACQESTKVTGVTGEYKEMGQLVGKACSQAHTASDQMAFCSRLSYWPDRRRMWLWVYEEKGVYWSRWAGWPQQASEPAFRQRELTAKDLAAGDATPTEPRRLSYITHHLSVSISPFLLSYFASRSLFPTRRILGNRWRREWYVIGQPGWRKYGRQGLQIPKGHQKRLQFLKTLQINPNVKCHHQISKALTEKAHTIRAAKKKGKGKRAGVINASLGQASYPVCLLRGPPLTRAPMVCEAAVFSLFLSPFSPRSALWPFKKLGRIWLTH